MYQGTLTDRNSKRDNGQPSSIKFRDECALKVLTHFSMIIKDCNLTEVAIKIKKSQALKTNN
tara:strand:+ start:415 stop:600 length:186 start_codon:yes stop_codon:yes gene_type:complete